MITRTNSYGECSQSIRKVMYLFYLYYSFNAVVSFKIVSPLSVFLPG
jgi:hypothetical protein